jgi:hypothetical protein
VVARSQQVSGEMEDICSGSNEFVKEKKYAQGLQKAFNAIKDTNDVQKVRAALDTVGTDTRDAFLGTFNLDILKNEREQLKDKTTLADRLQFLRTTSLLKSELARLQKQSKVNPSDSRVLTQIDKIQRELRLNDSSGSENV